MYINQKGIFLTAEDLIYKLYFFFNVNNNLDLANKLNTTPQTISNWKSRNSVNAINKKCRELGIYNQIFGDLNSNTIINIASEVNQAIKGKNEVAIDETTLFLFKEAYQKAKNRDNIKGLRIYLMDFDEDTEIIMPPKKVEKLTLNEFKNTIEDIKAKSK